MEAKLLVLHASIGPTRGSGFPRPPLCCSISQAVMMGRRGEIGGRGFDGVKASASPAGIHYGKFVTEANFQANPKQYEVVIKAQDSGKIMDMSTYTAVEEMVKRSVEVKARTFGQEVVVDVQEHVSEPAFKIEPRLIAGLYGEWNISLTKEVQVEYLLRRLD